MCVKHEAFKMNLEQVFERFDSYIFGNRVAT